MTPAGPEQGCCCVLQASTHSAFHAVVFLVLLGAPWADRPEWPLLSDLGCPPALGSCPSRLYILLVLGLVHVVSVWYESRPLCFQLGFQLTCLKKQRMGVLMPGAHMGNGMEFQVHGLVWPKPGPCSHLRNERTNGGFLSFLFTLPSKWKNKMGPLVLCSLLSQHWDEHRVGSRGCLLTAPYPLAGPQAWKG